jgi:hypothetical protein
MLNKSELLSRFGGENCLSQMKTVQYRGEASEFFLPQNFWILLVTKVSEEIIEKYRSIHKKYNIFSVKRKLPFLQIHAISVKMASCQILKSKKKQISPKILPLEHELLQHRQKLLPSRVRRNFMKSSKR